MVMRRYFGWYVAALVAAGAIVPAGAAAGTYTVRSCDASTALRADAWVTSVRPGESVDTVQTCATQDGDTDGVVNFEQAKGVRPLFPAPASGAVATNGRVAGLTLTAPAGASLTKVTYDRHLASTDPAWDVKFLADATLVEDCVNGTNSAGTSALGCASGTLPTTTLPPGTKALDLAAWCVAAPCGYSAGPLYNFAAALSGSVVTVSDPVPPTATAPVITNLSDGWVTAASRISFGGADALGLKDLQVAVDGAVASHVALPACVDWSLTPCAEASAGASTSPSVNVAAYGILDDDGVRSVTTKATDAAGNVTTSAPVTAKIDTTPPTPSAITGRGLSKDQFRTIGWTLPTDGSPIVRARVALCDYDVEADFLSDCTWSEAPVAGPFTANLASPTADVYAMVELTDQAGNVTPMDSYGAELIRDALAPAAPTIKLFGGTGMNRTFIVATKDYDAVTVTPRLCKGSSCTPLPAVAISDGGSTIVSYPVPAAGDYRAEATVSDYIGNVSDAASASFTVAAPLAAIGAGTGTSLGANGASGQLMKLTPIMPAKLSGSTILIRGTTVAGSASLISVTVAGRHTNGKAAVVVKAAKLAANGKFAVRLRLPSKLSRKKGVLVTIAATPTAGYAAQKVRKRVKG